MLLASAFSAQAAKIGDLTQTRWTEQAWRFVTLSDPVVRYACLGTLLLGISCGLLGSFLVVRRMALLGDAAVVGSVFWLGAVTALGEGDPEDVEALTKSVIDELF